MKLPWKFYGVIAAKVVACLLIVWIVCCVFLYHLMRKPPEQFGAFMAKLPGPVPFLIFPFETLWMQARSGTLQHGDAAPDFDLAKLDKSERVRLSSFAAQHQPVALIFGSYT